MDWAPARPACPHRLCGRGVFSVLEAGGVFSARCRRFAAAASSCLPRSSVWRAPLPRRARVSASALAAASASRLAAAASAFAALLGFALRLRFGLQPRLLLRFELGGGFRFEPRRLCGLTLGFLARDPRAFLSFYSCLRFGFQPRPLGLGLARAFFRFRLQPCFFRRLAFLPAASASAARRASSCCLRHSSAARSCSSCSAA